MGEGWRLPVMGLVGAWPALRVGRVLWAEVLKPGGRWDGPR